MWFAFAMYFVAAYAALTGAPGLFYLNSDGDAAFSHPRFGLAYGVFAVVKNAGSQYRIGTALLHAVGQVIKVCPRRLRQ